MAKNLTRNFQKWLQYKFFSDKEYRSLVTIPEVALTKGKQNCWIGRVWISEELFR